jgi:hypothetical protein
MPIEPVDKSLNRWLIDVTDVRGCLTRLTAGNNSMRVDEPESIYDDFTLYGLDGVNHDGDGP